MNEIRRIDFLTDGVFAIAATLLVLDVAVPAISPQHTGAELRQALREAAPTLVAFVFSFMTILTFWVNHDSVSRALTRYPYRLVWLNLVLLLWVSLIPFATKFISEYPLEPVASLAYGVVMLLCSSTAVLTYAYVAYWSDVLTPRVGSDARRRLLWRFLAGPALYLVACAGAFVNPRISIAIFILVPLLFFVPGIQERVLADLGATDEVRSG